MSTTQRYDDRLPVTPGWHPRKVIGLVILSGLLLFLLWPASQVFLVVFAACLFAVFVDGLARVVTDKVAIPKTAARFGVMIVLLVLALGFFYFAGQRLATQMTQLVEQLPRAIDHITKVITNQSLGELIQDIETEYLKPAGAKLLAGLTGVFSTAFEAVTNVLIILVIGLYLAISPETYVNGMFHLVPKPRRSRGQEILNMLGHALAWWLVGRFSSMLIVGVLTTIGLILIDMPLALVLGVIAGLFSFVPYVGPIVSAVPAILIALMESPLTALYVTLIYIFVQFIESNILTPLIQKRTVSLPPAVLLLAQFFMGVFYGILGVILATPFFIVLIVLIQMIYVEDIIDDRVTILGEHPDQNG